MNAPNELSFLPDDYLERKARRRANALCGVLAVLVMGAIGTTFTVTERAMQQVEKRHADVDREYNEAARRLEQVSKMRAQQQQVVRRAELAASLVEKVPRSNVLAEFTNSLPAGLSLLDLSLDARERVSAPQANSAFEQKRLALEAAARANVPQAKTYDVYLKLTGVAGTDVQVAQFITKLNASKLFRDVNLVVSESFEHQNETVRKFQIEMMLNPDAEVAELIPPTRTAAFEVAAPTTAPAVAAAPADAGGGVPAAGETVAEGESTPEPGATADTGTEAATEVVRE